ncbi:RagB/SusD family nutrient uptake outer membrane protein [Bacteroides uniformis]|nr:RagB/SusD family nutrient uptake outer membrane protein [Bacteroides uniformis]
MPLRICPDNAGYFSWKYRVYEADVINYYWLRCPNNTRAMRYAEVLLLAAEASLQSGNASKAVDYVNKVRNRAQLPALGSVSMDDIKKEKRLELWMEGCRYRGFDSVGRCCYGTCQKRTGKAGSL